MLAEQIQEKNLHRAFKFYSIQQNMMGKNPTFDQIYQNSNLLSKGKFLKFCIDFNFPLSQEAFIQIFNQSTGFSKEMTYNQFKEALRLLKGNKSPKDFTKFLGLDSSKLLLSKCKPFSKVHGKSLPDLPPVLPRPTIFRKSETYKKKGIETSSKMIRPRERKIESVRTESIDLREIKNKRKVSLCSEFVRGIQKDYHVTPKGKIISLWGRSRLSFLLGINEEQELIKNY